MSANENEKRLNSCSVYICIPNCFTLWFCKYDNHVCHLSIRHHFSSRFCTLPSLKAKAGLREGYFLIQFLFCHSCRHVADCLDGWNINRKWHSHNAALWSASLLTLHSLLTWHSAMPVLIPMLVRYRKDKLWCDFILHFWSHDVLITRPYCHFLSSARLEDKLNIGK